MNDSFRFVSFADARFADAIVGPRAAANLASANETKRNESFTALIWSVNPLVLSDDEDDDQGVHRGE